MLRLRDAAFESSPGVVGIKKPGRTERPGKTCPPCRTRSYRSTTNGERAYISRRQREFLSPPEDHVSRSRFSARRLFERKLPSNTSRGLRPCAISSQRA